MGTAENFVPKTFKMKTGSVSRVNFQSLYMPAQVVGLQEVQAPKFLDNRHLKMARLSALHTGRLYPPGDTLCTYLCFRLSRSQAVAYRGGVGGSTPPKFRSFDKAEPNSQFLGKYICNCLVFLFQHPN
jgi:hypothetical protein